MTLLPGHFAEEHAERSARGLLTVMLIVIIAALLLGSGTHAAEQSTVKDVADEALIRAGVPPREVAAMRKLDDCLDDTVEKLADQPEAAQVVADAALALCEPQEMEYIRAMGRVPYPDYIDTLKDTRRSQVAAEVMTIRADRAKRH